MFYGIFRAFLGLTLSIFYRRIEAPGLEAVPREGPLLIVANHGNALLDPVLLLKLVPRRISFLAKHTLFPMPVIGFFLKAIGGIPVYRRQDDPGQASRNAGMLDACREVLARGGAISVFPEGKSHDRPRLEPLRSGAARIYFRAAGAERGPARVLPVGINYEQKGSFRSRVLVLFGPPVPAEDLIPLEAAEPGKGAEELMRRIEISLRALVPGVETWEELEFIREIQHLYLGYRERSLAREAWTLRRFLDGYRRLQEIDPVATLAVRRRWEAYRRLLRRFSITESEVELAAAPRRALRFLLQSAAFALLVLPLAALGAFVHFLPYRACGWFERRLSRDPDMAATIKWIAGIALFLLTYLFVGAAAFLVGGPGAALVCIVVIPASGWAALRVAENQQRLAQSARALRLALPGGHALERIRRERAGILDDVAALARKLPVDGEGGVRPPAGP